MSANPSSNAAAAPPNSHQQDQQFAGSLGMWVFIGSELLFFGPLLFAYLYLRIQFPQASAEASRHTDFVLGTLNTALLLTGSLLVALAGQTAQAGRRRRASQLLCATAALGLCFLAIKGWEYHTEFAEHLFPGPGFRPEHNGQLQQGPGLALFFVLYFAATGLHALHLAVGIGACSWLAWRLRRPPPDGVAAEAVELGALYWHFVDIIWIFLYPLLYLVGRAGA